MKKSDLENIVSVLTGKVILLFITALLALITIVAMATHYVAGIVCTVFLMIAIRALLSVSQIEGFIEKVFNDDDGILF